jgi:hypothetical protein
VRAQGRDAGTYAAGAGVVAATTAALCCAGAPIIVSILAATGLSFIRDDAILLPVIVTTLVIAIWGFWKSRQRHRRNGPLAVATMGAISLVWGVVWLHGAIAKWAIGIGTAFLLVTAIWNARLAKACDTRVQIG